LDSVEESRNRAAAETLPTGKDFRLSTIMVIPPHANFVRLSRFRRSL
jgi:hypothetical protein